MHEIKFGNYVEVLALLFFELLENKLLRVVDKGPGQRERERKLSYYLNWMVPNKQFIILCRYCSLSDSFIERRDIITVSVLIKSNLYVIGNY